MIKRTLFYVLSILLASDSISACSLRSSQPPTLVLPPTITNITTIETTRSIPSFTPSLMVLPTSSPTPIATLPKTDQPAVTASSAVSTSMPWNGQPLAFLSERDGHTEIYAMDSDGTHLTQLTHDSTGKMSPVWNPAGDEIAFTAWPADSVFDEDANIYRMHLPGEDPVQVTFMSFTALQPRWSPRGDYIAYMSDDPGVTDIYTVNLLTHKAGKISVENLGPDIHMVPWQISPPNWSPDGQWIAYATAKGEAGYWDIYKYNVDTGETVQVTHSEAGDLEPVWSLDGSKIAFIRYLPAKCENDCNAEIFVMNSDGSDEKQLTDSPGVDAWPTWSPDSRTIAFISNRDGNLELYKLSLAGGDPVRLTNDAGTDYDPVWSPDGEEIVFVSDRSGDSDIYKIRSDGSGLINLTDHSADDYNPIWYWGK